MTNNSVQTLKIEKVVEECDNVKRFSFNIKKIIISNQVPKPGQFIMIWVPGIDEVPMSISNYDDNGTIEITVKNVGECTNALHGLKVGDFIGIRGPFGNYFPLLQDKNKKIFIVGGGIGMAPLKFLSSEYRKLGINVTLIEGAKCATQLIYQEELNEILKDPSKTIYCTDDGSFGAKAFATAEFENYIKNYTDKDVKKVVVYTCGPEIMMVKLLQICLNRKIDMYASLERVMRCGCGLCGLCGLDPLGLLVCKDGPVFNSETLRNITDFGKFNRDFTGRKIKLG